MSNGIKESFFIDPLEERRPEEKQQSKEEIVQEKISKVHQNFINGLNPLFQANPQKETKRKENISDNFTTFNAETGAMDIVNNRFID